jgi:hypothetical protein
MRYLHHIALEQWYPLLANYPRQSLVTSPLQCSLFRFASCILLNTNRIKARRANFQSFLQKRMNC